MLNARCGTAVIFLIVTLTFIVGASAQAQQAPPSTPRLLSRQ